MQSVNL